MRARWVALVCVLLVLGVLVVRGRKKPLSDASRVPVEVSGSDASLAQVPSSGPHVTRAIRGPGPVDPATGLRGVVLGPDRVPRAGVLVLVGWLADLPDGGVDEAQREAVTGADGEFAWDLQAGTYYVGATSEEGMAGERVSVDEGKTSRVALVLEETGLVLSGRVSDSLGGPIAGALVTCHGPIRVAARTGGEGAYTMHLPPDAKSPLVSVTAPGYVPDSTLAQVIDGKARADFVLDATASVRGRVLGASGSPAAGASVRLENNAHRLDATAKEDGSFDIRDVPPGSYRAVARRANEVGAAPDGLWVEVGTSIDDVTIVLAEGRSLRGTVRDDAGHPLGGAEVGLHDALSGLWNNASFTTSADGAYFFLGVPRGELSLVASADGYETGDRARASRTMAGQDLVGVDLVVERESGARITGRVVDRSRQPVARASVSYELMDASGLAGTGVTEADEDGAFTIRGLAAGTCTLTASAPPRGYGKVEVTVADKEEKEVELALEPGGELRGTVRWQGGAVAAGVYVRTGTGADPNGFFSGTPAVRTAGDGTFVLRDVEPGKHALKASRFADDDGLGPFRPAHVERFPDGVHPAAEYEVEGGETVQGIELVLARGGHTIAGSVAAAGQPFVGAAIHVGTATEREANDDGRTVRTATDGTFRFDDLDDGSYTVWATCREGPTAAQVVRTDAVGVRFACSSGTAP